MPLLSADRQWLDDFRARHGRAPRILHVGNIANNAYNNARLLNEAGLDCDVMCYDYYHVMACPEWEDADFSGDYGDQYKPNWAAAGLRDFERPRWFAQGPVLACIDYLVARREGWIQEAEGHWRTLAILNDSPLPPASDRRTGMPFWSVRWRRRLKRMTEILSFMMTGSGVALKAAEYCYTGRVAALAGSEIMRMLAAWGLMTFALVLRIGGFPFRRLLNQNRDAFDARVAQLVDQFAKGFPSRADALSAADARMYRQIAPQWSRLFQFYDLVQAYATDPILPMLAGKRPYIGFEHGTLRSHTLGNDQVCRLTSLAYHLADHVFITNGDCIEYARKIGVTRFTPMLHPIDERRIASIAGINLREQLGASHVFLCTLRHDWAIKGTDQYIRALPGLVKVLGRGFRVIMARWGAELDRSIALAEALGVGDLIVWSEPLPRRRLIQTLKSADVLFDQLALPHFGATAPEGIAAGVPVIMSYDSRSTEWLVAEPAPILTAHDPGEIVEQVLRALDPAWLADYRQRAAKWFGAHHSFRLVVQGHLDVYRRLLPAH